jgi:hypothetical protein
VNRVIGIWEIGLETTSAENKSLSERHENRSVF